MARDELFAHDGAEPGGEIVRTSCSRRACSPYSSLPCEDRNNGEQARRLHTRAQKKAARWRVRVRAAWRRRKRGLWRSDRGGRRSAVARLTHCYLSAPRTRFTIDFALYCGYVSSWPNLPILRLSNCPFERCLTRVNWPRLSTRGPHACLARFIRDNAEQRSCQISGATDRPPRCGDGGSAVWPLLRRKTGFFPNTVFAFSAAAGA